MFPHVRCRICSTCDTPRATLRKRYGDCLGTLAFLVDAAMGVRGAQEESCYSDIGLGTPSPRAVVPRRPEARDLRRRPSLSASVPKKRT